MPTEQQIFEDFLFEAVCWIPAMLCKLLQQPEEAAATSTAVALQVG